MSNKIANYICVTLSNTSYPIYNPSMIHLQSFIQTPKTGYSTNNEAHNISITQRPWNYAEI